MDSTPSRDTSWTSVVLRLWTAGCAGSSLVAGLLGAWWGQVGGAHVPVRWPRVFLVGCGVAVLVGAAALLLARRLRPSLLAFEAALRCTGDLAGERAPALPGRALAPFVEAAGRAITNHREEAQRLRATLGRASDAVEGGAGQMEGAADRTREAARTQGMLLQQTSEAVYSIGQTTIEATHHADTVQRLAERSEAVSREGREMVEEGVAATVDLGDSVENIAEAMTQLGTSLRESSRMVDAVEEVARQSHLLALNATLEATRIGAEGRAFAVIARQMRELAGRSKSTAEEIARRLEAALERTEVMMGAAETGRQGAQRTVTRARAAGDAIVRLTGVIQEAAVAARKIAGVSKEQAGGVEAIHVALAELSEALASTESDAHALTEAGATVRAAAAALSALAGAADAPPEEPRSEPQAA